MSAIVAFGSAVPRRRLENAVLAQARGRPAAPGLRAIPGPDEDAVTLGVEAALDALAGTTEVPRTVIFATTSPPILEGPTAALVAEACRLVGARTIDLGHSGRGGLCGLTLAADLASSGPVLVIAAETRLAPPGSDQEPLLGSGAAACVVTSAEDVGFAIRRRVVKSAPQAPMWRTAEGLQWADLRFGRTVLYGEPATAVLQELLDGVDRERLAGIALQAPDPGSGVKALKSVGLDPRTQYRDHVSPMTGDTGCAHPLLMAAAAAERLREGALLGVLAAADGIEAVLLECVSPVRASVKAKIKATLPVSSVVRAMELSSPTDPEGFRSEMLDARERGPTWRLEGTRCGSCGTTWTLGPARCPRCDLATDPCPLARTGIVFSWTREHYVPTPEPPLGMVIVDLDGGGRLTTQWCDAAAEPAVGQRAELVFRRVHAIGGRPGYYWKARAEGGSDAR